MILTSLIGLRENTGGVKMDNFEGQDFIAESPAMKQVVLRALRFAANEEFKVVSLFGPSGSGKNYLAKLIHRTSPRAQKSLVTVNCPEIPPSLREAELFGFERGSFTNAFESRDGYFQLAQGSSIFLNEICQTDVAFQRLLLGVFDEWKVRPIGKSKEIELNIKVIVGSSKDLKQMVESKEFIEPLYYRISAITIIIPPLCQRIEDIQPLAEYFIKKHNAGRIIEISQEALAYLKAYAWPGNLRELDNEIQRIIFDNLGLTIIRPEHLDRQIREGVTLRAAQEVSMRFEKEHIARVLNATKGNIKRTAQILDIPRTTLNSKIKRLDLTNFGRN